MKIDHSLFSIRLKILNAYPQKYPKAKDGDIWRFLIPLRSITDDEIAFMVEFPHSAALCSK